LLKLLSFILSSFFYLVFGFLLLFFHFIQWICLKFITSDTQKKSVDLLCFFITKCFKIINAKISFQNIESIPEKKIKIFVLNHQSLFEIPPLIWYLRKFNPKFISKQELGKGIPSISFHLRNGGSVLINRKNKTESLERIKKFCNEIKLNNSSIIIFPEGTRSISGVSRKFKTNGLRIIMEEIPDSIIIPITINCSYKLNQWNGFPLPLNIQISFNILEQIVVNDKKINNIIVSTEKKINDFIMLSN
jgi:1-acyl-sn-glycerol-3-phosphate acyltransferase